MSRMEMINIENVSKTFCAHGKTVNALSDINLDIEEGCFVCIIGGSGCGKSTLMNVIAGFEKADTGRVVIAGEEVTRPDAKRQMIFQNYGLFPWRTVEGNIRFALENDKTISPKERKEKVAKYLDLVGLHDFAHSYPHQLSGGMRQRVAVARALAAEPQIIFMDEPFGALDAITKMKLQDEVNKICTSEKRTVIMVTHDIDEAVYLGDRILVMKPAPGRIFQDIKVDLPKPRLRTGAGFTSLRSRLLESLDLAIKTEPDYTI